MSDGRLSAVATEERGVIRDAWTRVRYWLLPGETPIVRERGRLNASAHPEVRTALRSSSETVLAIENGEEILSIAVPIQRSAVVEGVLVLSARLGL